MSSIWPQLEEILDDVQKPARYIGCEDGVITPQHHPSKIRISALLKVVVFFEISSLSLLNVGVKIGNFFLLNC